ncbi:MAG: peptidyl-prolyl cis-trans isomerase [Candidatus Omnitrophica bacterium]|nr:peptidyl-prolyl cis-trans isomerase [Candidatus Omnitrophota bacterium]
MRKKIIVLAAVTLLATTYSNVYSQKPAGAKATEQAAAQSTARTQEKDGVLAKVGDWSITADEFNNALEKLKPYLAAQKVIIGPEFKERMLDELVEQEILAQTALAKGSDQDPEVLEALKRYKSALLAAKMMEDLQKSIATNEAEVKSFYEKNKDIFANPPKEIKISEIALDTQAQVNDIQAALSKGGDFAAIARTASKAPSAKDGGDLGYMPLKEIILKSNDIEPADPTMANDGKTPPLPDRPKEFWEKAAGLEKGKTSEPFKASDGKFYVIKAADIKGGQTILPLSDVGAYIEEYLKMKEFNRALDKLVADFKASKKVEINKDLLK